MKISKILALVLTLALILPFIVSCGSQKEGTPVTFNNVTVITTYDQDAADEADDADAAETAEAAAPAEDDEYEEELFSGEVVVYVKDEANLENVTLRDVLLAYGDADNMDVTIDGSGRVKQIGNIGVFGGYFWNVTVNGSEKPLDTVVNPDDTIVIIFQK